MADVGVNVIYQSDTTAAKAAWDTFITYTQQNQPKWGAEPQSGAPGSGGTTATTFGGLNTVAPPVGSNLGAGFGTPGTQAASAAVAAQVTVLHQQAQQNAQDLVSRLSQSSASSGAQAGIAGDFVMRHPFPSGRGTMYSGGFDSASARGSQGTPFEPLIGQGSIGPGTPNRGAFAMAAPVAVDPFADDAYLGRGTRRTVWTNPNRPRTPTVSAAAEEGGGGYDPDDIGWTYNPSAGGGGGGGSGGASGVGWRAALRSKLGNEGYRSLGRVLSAYQITKSATDILNSSNQYNIAMAGATGVDDIINAEKQKQQNSWLAQLPVVGGLGSAIRESFTGENAALTRTQTDLKLSDANANTQQSIITDQRNYRTQMAVLSGQYTGDPSAIRAGMRSQSNTELQNSRDTYKNAQTLRFRDLDAIPDEDISRRQTLQNSIELAQQQQKQLESHISGLYEANMTGYNLGQSFSHLGVAEDIQDRNRYTEASGYRGRMFERTASAMDEITGDRRAVEEFNQTHIGTDWAAQRAQNTASVIASQRQSFANLQYLSQIPGNAQEVSGMTFFGDFSNQSYKDYQKALSVSATGTGQISDAASSSDITAGVTDVTAQALLNAIQQLTNVIGGTGGVQH